MTKFGKETAVGIFMVLGLALVVYLAVKLGNVSIFGNTTYPLVAQFNKATGLRLHNSVKMLGLEIGYIANMHINQEHQQAVVALRIRKGIKIYSDAIASIKTEGLIGEKYVSIDAGGAGTLLEPGDKIIETVPPVDLIDLIGKYAFGTVK